MKVIVFAHRLEIGGTQNNAIDLACGLRDLHGCDVILHATPGPMKAVALARGLRFVPAPDGRVHPAPARMKALRQLVRAERPDLIHAWDWWQCLDAYYSVYLPWGVPLLTTDMTLALARVLPALPLTTFGTPQMVDIARTAGRRNVALLLPPTDVQANAPGCVEASQFRQRFGIDRDKLNIVTVSRLSHWMKSESLVRTIDAVRRLGRDAAVRFVIVGDGAARSRLEALAQQTNQELGRRAVLLTGALLDPRPAYEAADIVVGMGSSALRGMAFARATVVVGEAGFSATFDRTTAARLYHTGMYGIGDGDRGNARLAGQLRALADERDRLPGLGLLGRGFVEQHFALDVGCAHLMDLCHQAIAQCQPLKSRLLDSLRTSAVYLRERRFLRTSRDRGPVDAIGDATAPSTGWAA